ncbi:MAG: plastocyanin/azurin family copper-binding protein [Cytophagales bacterium]|nr:plastocyanin/azurin family copper-binding protein [Cytophagales bacterium]
MKKTQRFSMKQWWVSFTVISSLLITTAWAQKPLTEEDFYQIQTLPLPAGVAMEVGGMATLPDGRLAVCTRRGEVWLISNPTMEGGQPYYQLFAQGLHEPLGLAYKDGALYTAQRGELTKLIDKNGDDVADVYEAVYSFPLTGNYHEYTYGPVIAPDGTMYCTTNVGFWNPEWWIGRSRAPWRGWAVAISPDGNMTPFATGLRSPCGIGLGPEGEFFYGDNQGDWIGSGFVAHVEKGDFVGGNPAGLAWATLPESPVKVRAEQIVSSDNPQFELAARVPGIKLPAVWLPHSILGISTAEMLMILPREGAVPGKFGPFDGQMLVADQGQSKIMRVALEKVKGQYQGVAFNFREGFMSGALRLEWAKDGSLFVGQTNRGWGSTGKEPYGLQRLVWTGKIPFEIKTVRAMPDGFELEFTQPVNQQTAQNAASYKISSFTYKYHWEYGSPIIRKQDCPIRGVIVSADGMKVRLVADGLREKYIHEIQASGVTNTNGQFLLHDTGYYTLNNIPDGEKVQPEQLTVITATLQANPISQKPEVLHLHHHATAQDIPANGNVVLTEQVFAKRMNIMPASWGTPDVSISLGTKPGLKYDKEKLEVKAGAKVRLVFSNPDDMPHNFVLTMPGKANEVGTAALKLGVSGPEMEYVPDSPQVLYHTGMVAPGKSETIYFVAPEEPGDYQFVCTYPGHAFVMQGIFKVVR